MKRALQLHALLWTCRAVVWTASWIVPRGRRREWARQRQMRAWHWCHFLVESGRFSRATELDLLRNCWGAYTEALWERLDRGRFLARLQRARRSPWLCLATLALALAVLAPLTGFAPEARSMLSLPYQHAARLFTLRPAGRFEWFRSDTLLGVTGAWRKSKLIEDLAAYSWGPGTLTGGGRSVGALTARVSPRFFEVLEVRAARGRTFTAGDLAHCAECVLLSDDAWEELFHRDPNAIGQLVQIKGREQRVIGILPERFAFMTPGIAAWSLLDPSAPPFTNFVDRMGAVARFAPGVSAAQAVPALEDLSENEGYYFRHTRLEVTSLRAQARQATKWYLLFLLLAIGGSVAIVRSGRARANAGQQGSKRRDVVRWWAYFLAKSGLLLAAVFVVALELARYLSVAFTGTAHGLAGILSLWLFMVGAIGALSWAIHDQRQRCRVCLQRLGMSAHVGCPSYSLLDWAATEMMCAAGHGMLHIPDTESSWLDHDRWNHLDESWAELFERQQPSS
jgi:hypothetical protein